MGPLAKLNPRGNSSHDRDTNRDQQALDKAALLVGPAPHSRPQQAVCAAAGITRFTMTTFTCLLATVLAVLTIPFLLIWRATESRPQRIRRWRRHGLSWQTIATRYGVSTSTVRRWAA